MTFEEIVRCTGGITRYTGADFKIAGIQFDSRLSVRGKAFIAFTTASRDGHDFIPVAAAKGALALIVSRDIDPEIPEIPTVKVPDTLKAYQDIAAFHRKKFTAPIVAITGSNGKTTVKDMLSAVLSVKYKVLATEKNLNNQIGVPQTLLNLSSAYTAAVVEIGMNHSGEIRSLSDIVKPDIAIITEIGTAHAGNLGGTRADVFRAKMEIAENLTGTLILNSGDDLLSSVKPNGQDVLFCGLNGDERNILSASNIRQFWNDDGCGLSFTVRFGGEEFDCTLPVIGRHNVKNALLALTAGMRLGVDLKAAIAALQMYPRSSMRMETSAIRGIKFIKDYYNASPESMTAAIDALAELRAGVSGSLIGIFGDMLELGEQSASAHREIASYTEGKLDSVYFTGHYSTAFAEGRKDCRCFPVKEELNAALSAAVLGGGIKSGDAVLIKGSNGMKMWEQYELIRKLLERGSAVPAQTRLLVDIDALKFNYTEIKNYVGSGVQVLPVIKADAYGSGADLLANIYSGCNFFAVADLREAEELHKLMPSARFLILYEPFAEEADLVAERDYVTVSVSQAGFVRKLDKAASKVGKTLFVHIEVDTGMCRLGVTPENCAELSKTLSECKNLVTVGIFTHYSSADLYTGEALEFTAMQTRRFKEAVKTAESVLGKIKYKHACAGAAIFNPNAELFNMVRPGYILRGYYPCEEIKSKINLRPALKYVTRVTQVKECGEGARVSYSGTFVTKRKTRLAEIPVGYSDGLMRGLSNNGAFVVSGQLAPIVGNITMDYTMIDVTDIKPEVRAGDEVSIFDNVNMTIERMAELCRTIGYEVITGIKDKADRIECF